MAKLAPALPRVGVDGLDFESDSGGTPPAVVLEGVSTLVKLLPIGVEEDTSLIAPSTMLAAAADFDTKDEADDDPVEENDDLVVVAALVIASTVVDDGVAGDKRLCGSVNEDEEIKFVTNGLDASEEDDEVTLFGACKEEGPKPIAVAVVSTSTIFYFWTTGHDSVTVRCSSRLSFAL